MKKSQPTQNKPIKRGGTTLPPKPAQATLQSIPAPNPAPLVRFNCPEFTCLCPLSGLPDFAKFVIDYLPHKSLLESKSVKLYLASWRNVATFHEQCTVAIATALIKAAKPKWLRIGGFWYPRGGIPIDVFYQTGHPPADIHIPPLK